MATRERSPGKDHRLSRIENCRARETSRSRTSCIAAGGWSHEIYLFYANWNEDGRAMRQGFCLRKDPGAGLLRELSESPRAVSRHQGARSDARTDAESLLVRGRSIAARRAILRDGKSRGRGSRIHGRAPESSSMPRLRSAESCRRASSRRSRRCTTSIGAPPGLDFIGVPGGGKDFVLREIAKWESLINQSIRKPEPVLTELLMWLKANAPEAKRLAFVHGAYRTGNLIIKDDAIAAVIDWELQVIGDPMYDVAYVLSDLNREGSPLLSCVVEREFFHRLLPAAHRHRDRSRGLPLLRHALHDAQHGVLAERVGTLCGGPQQGSAPRAHDLLGAGGSRHGGQGARLLTSEALRGDVRC